MDGKKENKLEGFFYVKSKCGIVSSKVHRANRGETCTFSPLFHFVTHTCTCARTHTHTEFLQKSSVEIFARECQTERSVDRS